MMIADFLPIFAGLLGACIGSFLNVCIYRIPLEGLSISKPKWSFCPKCENPLVWHDNVPVLGWLFLGGKCRSCKAPIAFRYPFVESLTAALFVLVVLKIGDGSLTGQNLILVGFWALLFAVLVVITFIDIDHRIIPDELSVGGSCLAPIGAWLISGVPVDEHLPLWLMNGLAKIDTALIAADATALVTTVLAFAAVVGGVVTAVLFRRHSPAWDGSRRRWRDTPLAATLGALGALFLAGSLLVDGWSLRPDSEALLASLLGMTTGAGAIYGMGVFGKMIFRKDAMGFGDVKLMALLGALLGWKGVLIAVFLACLLGSIVGIFIKLITGSSYMPFGPYLSAGAVIQILWNDTVAAVFQWYMNLFPK